MRSFQTGVIQSLLLEMQVHMSIKKYIHIIEFYTFQLLQDYTCIHALLNLQNIFSR